MWAGSPYAEAPWAAPVIPSTITVGTIPPPVPGESQSYTWSAQLPVRPWAFGGWAGGIAPSTFLGGGVQAIPDPSTGTVEVQAWWPNIPSLELMRITPDGVITPVRGGFPILNGRTRFNYCNNPSGAAGNNGWFPEVGNPSLTTGTRSDTGGPCILVGVQANGEVSFDVPQANAPNERYLTVGFDLLLPRQPGTVKLVIRYLDANGDDTASSTVAIDPNTINASINQWSRVVVAVQPPDNASTVTEINVDLQSMVAGDQIGLSLVTVESASTDGSAADGSVLGGFWNGTPGLSTSTVAPVMTVIDGECPLDIVVNYQVWNTTISGGEATSPPVTLDSRGQSWLSHSSDPEHPLSVSPTATPVLKRALPQTGLAVIGRPRPVVITSGVRQAPSGTITFDSPDHTYRALILGLMRDGTALLFRAPADYGYGPGQWLQFGDLDEDAQGRPAYLTTRALTVPFQEVDPPVNTNLTAV